MVSPTVRCQSPPMVSPSAEMPSLKSLCAGYSHQHAQSTPNLSLTFLNLLVGEDDITADKDFKHIFKRQHNLMLRNKGFIIEGFFITPSILHGQLQANGVPLHRIRSLLNPNDKQDVVLGYSLLKKIWSLPAASETTNYMFGRA